VIDIEKMALLGFSWLCLALLGFAWLCLALLGLAWLCLAFVHIGFCPYWLLPIYNSRYQVNFGPKNTLQSPTSIILGSKLAIGYFKTSLKPIWRDLGHLGTFWVHHYHYHTTTHTFLTTGNLWVKYTVGFYG
jgi:hypothetical protein